MGALEKYATSSKPVPSSKETKGMVKTSRQMSTKASSNTIYPCSSLNGSSNPKNQAGKPGSRSGHFVIQANGSLRNQGRNGANVVTPRSNVVKGVKSDIVKRKEPLLNGSKLGKDQQRLSNSQPTNMQKTVPIKAPAQTFQVEQRKPPVMENQLSKPVKKLGTKVPPKIAPKPAPKTTNEIVA